MIRIVKGTFGDFPRTVEVSVWANFGRRYFEFGVTVLSAYLGLGFGRADAGCPNCVGVTVLDERPMYCEACGTPIKQARTDTGNG